MDVFSIFCFGCQECCVPRGSRDVLGKELPLTAGQRSVGLKQQQRLQVLWEQPALLSFQLPALKMVISLLALLVFLILQLWFCLIVASLPSSKTGLEYLLLPWPQGDDYEPRAWAVLPVTFEVKKALGSESSGEKAGKEQVNNRRWVEIIKFCQQC